ncbi:MAG: cytochrome c maturation protein CcmE [SAR324 cluster bacterium]|nr:cytochrome c maturation protein CcmE [SAR324 cluster bacterium]MBL7034975.1 cytochrome c maturation protein CcmE [SAR324 cluster bacterium]
MKTRTKFVIGGAVIIAVITALSIQSLQEMTVFFYTPQEVLASPNEFENKTIRIGALVQKSSVEWDAQAIKLSFNITEDGKKFIPVIYAGVKPDLFREGQGVVVEGKMQGQHFEARQLLVKHSEEYSVETEHQKTKEEYYKSIQTN